MFIQADDIKNIIKLVHINNHSDMVIFAKTPKFPSIINLFLDFDHTMFVETKCANKEKKPLTRRRL